MLLAIDIGNTNTVAGVYDNSNLINHFRVASNHRLTVDECGFFLIGILEKLKISPEQIDRAVIASVVPRLTPIYEKMSVKYFDLEPLLVSFDIKLPITIAYDDPSAVGADRIANAVAAYDKYKSAVISVDFGTTTNFDVIDKGGAYLGGIIAPGPEMSMIQLGAKAAKLFEVSLEKPQNAIGRNTADSIRSGIFLGTIGMVDSLIERILAELGGTAKIIATGGMGERFVKESKYLEESIPDLTLEGLRIISDYQR